MRDIELYISNLIERQFPAVYREEGPNLVAFIKAYYEWMESGTTFSDGQTLYQNRRVLGYSDIDQTVDEYITYFKSEYLQGIQFDTLTDKRLVVKKILDLYRTKGSPRAIELLFRLVFGEDIELYYPGRDVFKSSDNVWVIPIYLEVSDNPNLSDYYGQEIIGVSTGATAFVDRIVKRRVNSKYVNLLYISNIKGDFETGERIRLDSNTDLTNVPFVLGSVTDLDVIEAGANFIVGEVVDLISTRGVSAKASVTSISAVTGIVKFTLIDGGFGYTVGGSQAIVSSKVLSLSNVYVTNTELITDPFDSLEEVQFITSNRLTAIRVTGSPIGYNNTDYIVVSNGIVNAVATFVTNAAGQFATNDITIVDKGYFQYGLSNTEVGITVYASNGSLSNGSGVTLGANLQGASDLQLFTVTVSGSPSGYNNSDFIRVSNGTSDATVTFVTNAAGQFSSANTTVQVKGVFPFGLANNQVSITAYAANGTASNGTGATFTANLSSIYANVTANIVGTSTNTVMYLTGVSGVFSNNESVTVGNSTATLLYPTLDGSNAQLVTSNRTGVFLPSQTVTGLTSGATGTLDFYNTDIGVYNLSTGIDVVNYSAVKGATSNSIARLEKVSFGSGATFDVGSISLTDNFSYNTDYLSGNNVVTVPYMSILLDGSNSTLPSNAYGFPLFPSANINSKIADSLTYQDFSIGTITSISGINPGSEYNESPYVLILDSDISKINKKDYILDISSLVGAFTETETVTQNVEVANSITLNVNTVSGFTYGALVYQTDGITPSATGSIFGITGNSLIVSEISGTFTNTLSDTLVYNTNALVNAQILTVNSTHYSATAVGKVTTLVDNKLYVKRYSMSQDFVPGLGIVGSSSGATANVDYVGVDLKSKVIGENAVVNAYVQTSNGSVTGFKVKSSGYGYVNSEIVTFVSESNTTNFGSAKVISRRQGVEEGYYKNTSGFLSEDKYIQDGIYYQDFSYEIRSGLDFSKYSDMVKKVVHVAGTELFGAVYTTSRANVGLSNVTTTITTV